MKLKYALQKLFFELEPNYFIAHKLIQIQVETNLLWNQINLSTLILY